MHERAGVAERRLTPLEREVILGAAARDAIDAGAVPPFRLRPGLIAEMLTFYDALQNQQRTIDAFERNVSAQLERDADLDRGARRLLDQTRFLAVAFRAFESRVDATGALDDAGLRRRLLQPDASPGFSHIVVAVGDGTAEPSGGLSPADFDLMTRLPGVVAIDIVATERQLACGLHERLRNLIPDLEETEAAWLPVSTRLEAPANDAEQLHFTSRDREEELRAVARRIRATARRPGPTRALARTAVVFKRPLPYVYLATTVFGAAGIEYQVSDALPLAAEPIAAVLESHLRRRGVALLTRGAPRPDAVAARGGGSLRRTALGGRRRRVRPRARRGSLPRRPARPGEPGRAVERQRRRGGPRGSRAGGGARAVRRRRSRVGPRLPPARPSSRPRAHGLRGRRAAFAAPAGARRRAVGTRRPEAGSPGVRRPAGPLRRGGGDGPALDRVADVLASARCPRRPPGRRAGGALRRVRRAAPGRARGGRLAGASVAQHLLPGVSPVRARMAVTGRPAGRRAGRVPRSPHAAPPTGVGLDVRSRRRLQRRAVAADRRDSTRKARRQSYRPAADAGVRGRSAVGDAAC